MLYIQIPNETNIDYRVNQACKRQLKKVVTAKASLTVVWEIANKKILQVVWEIATKKILQVVWEIATKKIL